MAFLQGCIRCGTEVTPNSQINTLKGFFTHKRMRIKGDKHLYYIFPPFSFLNSQIL